MAEPCHRAVLWLELGKRPLKSHNPWRSPRVILIGRSSPTLSRVVGAAAMVEVGVAGRRDLTPLALPELLEGAAACDALAAMGSVRAGESDSLVCFVDQLYNNVGRIEPPKSDNCLRVSRLSSVRA